MYICTVRIYIYAHRILMSQGATDTTHLQGVYVYMYICMSVAHFLLKGII